MVKDIKSATESSAGQLPEETKSAGVASKPLVHVFRIFLGAVFIYASYDKILHPLAFAKIVYNYGILPDALVNMAALALPWVELLIGLFLVFGLWLQGASVLCSFLLTVFFSALVFNQIRGLDIHCGCFSTETTGSPANLWAMARTFFFWGISIYVLLQTLVIPSGPPLRWLRNCLKRPVRS